jgi:hypothetical protein
MQTPHLWDAARVIIAVSIAVSQVAILNPQYAPHAERVRRFAHHGPSTGNTNDFTGRHGQCVVIGKRRAQHVSRSRSTGHVDAAHRTVSITLDDRA